MSFRTFLAATAMGAALAAPVDASDLTSLSGAERDAFRDEVRAYLLDNPEVLMEAIKVLETRQADQQGADDMALVKSNAKDLFEDETSFVGGNPDGDLTIVEFMDYSCGYCKKAFPEVETLLKTDGNIRFIIKEYPILGEASVLAARFALATRALGGDEAYENVHNALMTMRGKITEKALDQMATQFGLDAKEVRARMQQDDIDQIIAENQALAQRMQITGTPTFVFGEQMVRGYVPLNGMTQIVASERND